MEEIREALLLGKGAKVSVPRSRGFRSFSLSAAIPPGEELRPTRWAGAIGEPLAALEAL